MMIIFMFNEVDWVELYLIGRSNQVRQKSEACNSGFRLPSSAYVRTGPSFTNIESS